MKEEGQVSKLLPQIFSFLPQDLVMIFQSLVTILPRFFDLETKAKPLGKNSKIVAMYMMNKCATFYVNILSGYRLKFNIKQSCFPPCILLGPSTYNLKLSITSEEFTEELQDSQSEAYRQMASRLSEAVC